MCYMIVYTTQMSYMMDNKQQVTMVRCPFCPHQTWAPLVQGNKTVFARCPMGHRMYGLTGQTLDELVHQLRRSGSEVLTIGADNQPGTSPGSDGPKADDAGSQRDPYWRWAPSGRGVPEPGLWYMWASTPSIGARN